MGKGGAAPPGKEEAGAHNAGRLAAESEGTMSLTSELKDLTSPVAQFFRENFPHVDAVRRAWRLEEAFEAEVAGRGDREMTLRPKVADPSARPPYHTIGTALDYRLRYYFRVTPWGRLVASQGAALASEVSAGKWAVALVPAFEKSLTATLRDVRPVRRQLRRSQEARLCRHCYVLALFEEIGRAGPSIRSPLYTLRPGATLLDLLALATPAWVDDLRRLSWAFYKKFRLLRSKCVELNPRFEGSMDVGGADADLIIDGCLIDIKATVRPERLDRNWLYELLGYVLLDYRDKYRIDSVGIYFARQVRLVEWRLDRLVPMIARNPRVSLSRLRRSFRKALRAPVVAAG